MKNASCFSRGPKIFADIPERSRNVLHTLLDAGPEFYSSNPFRFPSPPHLSSVLSLPFLEAQPRPTIHSMPNGKGREKIVPRGLKKNKRKRGFHAATFLPPPLSVPFLLPYFRKWRQRKGGGEGREILAADPSFPFLMAFIFDFFPLRKRKTSFPE